jgi:hypothetical protein
VHDASRCIAIAIAVLAWAGPFAPVRAFAQPVGPAFAVQSIASAGRSVAAEFGDFDGDGRAELLTVVVEGMAPDEKRTLHVHAAQPEGGLAPTPTWSAPLPPGVATYDVADLDGAPGLEVLLLDREGIRVLAGAGADASWRRILVPAPPTIAVRPDERGLDRLRLARSELGSRRLLVPGLGEAWVLESDGAVVARLDVGGRANFLVPVRPGPAIGENEIELYFDVPTLQTADVDGDGRADVVATNRHALRIHRQRPDGSFATAPDREIPLRLIPLDDHVRNTGSVRSELRDLNGDGRADLLVSHTSGGFLRAANRTRIHLNRDGGFDLARPDQVFERSGGVAADELVDLDGDGRPEWLRIFLRFGLLQMAELFVQRRVDVDAAIHRPATDGRFDEAPWIERRVTLPFDFETLRPRGFPPTVGADWNGDSHRDWISSGGGTSVEVSLGGPERRFASTDARQELDSVGRLRVGDVDGDGLPDFVLYDPRRIDAPVRVGINRGSLPGTTPRLLAR